MQLFIVSNRNIYENLNGLKMSFEIGVSIHVFEDIRHKQCIETSNV